jgi:hypothetical protein
MRRLLVAALGVSLQSPKLQLGPTLEDDLQSVDFSEVRIGMDWRIGALGLDDPKLDDNDRRADIVWCGTRSTSEGCKAAGPSSAPVSS